MKTIPFILTANLFASPTCLLHLPVVLGVKSQARFPLNWTPYFTHCPRLSVWTNLRRGVRNCLPLFSQGGQVKVRKEGAVLKRTFSARGNFLRTWEIVTSSQARKKNPSAAQCKAEGSTPRETAKGKGSSSMWMWLQISACNTHCGTSQNTKCKQTQNKKGY